MTRRATIGGTRASIKCHQAQQNDKLDLSPCLRWSQPLSFETYPWRAGAVTAKQHLFLSACTPTEETLIVLIEFPRVNAISHCRTNQDDCFEQVNRCLGTIESGRVLL